MLNKTKSFLACLVIGFGIFFPKTALADSVMINKEVADSSSFYIKENGNLTASESIDETDLYNMVGEDDNYYN